MPTAAAPPATTSLASALVLFQSALPIIGKDKTANVTSKTGQSYRYKYADLSAISEAVMPLLTAVGLSFAASPRRNEDGSYDLVGVLRHGASGETDEGVLPLFTRGTAQETGSSITYARRYLLCTMTGIVPDEDDDGIAATRAQNAVQNTPQQRPAEDPTDAARTQAFNRFAAINAGATRDQFIAAVVQEFALPFLDVTADQLGGFAK